MPVSPNRVRPVADVAFLTPGIISGTATPAPLPSGTEYPDRGTKPSSAAGAQAEERHRVQIGDGVAFAGLECSGAPARNLQDVMRISCRR